MSSLPAEYALEVVAGRYIVVATLSVSLKYLPIGLALSKLELQIFMWEILINIDNDYNLLFEHRPHLPTAVYLISR